MILPSGTFIQVRRLGTHADDGRTRQLIDFWEADADFKPEKPSIRVGKGSVN